MGYGTQEIDLTDCQLSLCWKLAPSCPRCRTNYTYWDAFQTKLQKELRDNEKDISDVSLLGASHMTYLSEFCGRGHDGCYGFERKDDKVREQMMEASNLL